MPHSRTERLLTAEDLYRYPDTDTEKYELERGRLVVSEPPGLPHGYVSTRISVALFNFVEPRGLGLVAGEAGFVLRRGPDTVRGPDASFIRRERLPAGPVPEGFFEGAPDLVVEVISPSERPGAVARKVAAYFEGGASIVWTVYPRRQLVVVHTPDGAKRVARAPESLDGGDVLPGFTLPVADVFRGY